MDHEQLKQIQTMSFRNAQAQFQIGYPVWKRIKSGESEVYRRSRGTRNFHAHAENIVRVLQSVKAEPHLNTLERSKKLGIRNETVQKILKGEKLNKLNLRLAYAGFKVEAIRPLQAARKRRIVAAAPGRLLHVDHKLFGVLRGQLEEQAVKISGAVVIDGFTSFAVVHLCNEPTGESVVRAIEKFEALAPFSASQAIILSDNYQCFYSDYYLKFCASRGYLPRTIRIGHPWSNGKVESLNKTLKYQCFPVICCTMGLTMAQIQGLIDAWMRYYNEERVHTGHMNRGLPPVALYEHYRKTAGTPIEKLVKLGILKENDLQFLRGMGFYGGKSGKIMHNFKVEPSFTKGIPPALIVDRADYSGFVPREKAALNSPSRISNFDPQK